MNARHWYHCSEQQHGEAWTAERRVPVTIGKTEPLTPRLCVGRSVAACFAARYFSRPVYVYRTEWPRRTVRPVGVWDAVITGERWVIPPAPMVLVDVVPGSVVAEAGAYFREWFECGGYGRTPDAFVRLMMYRQAIVTLGEYRADWVEGWERRFVSKALAYFQAKERAA